MRSETPGRQLESELPTWMKPWSKSRKAVEKLDLESDRDLFPESTLKEIMGRGGSGGVGPPREKGCYPGTTAGLWPPLCSPYFDNAARSPHRTETWNSQATRPLNPLNPLNRLTAQQQSQQHDGCSTAVGTSPRPSGQG